MREELVSINAKVQQLTGIPIKVHTKMGEADV